MTSDHESERDRSLRAMLVATSSAEGRARLHRRRPWVIGLASALAVVALTGAAVTTSAIVATFHSIPHSTHRAPDPVATQSPSLPQSGGDTGSVPAQEVSMDQLWAISNGDPIPADQSNPLAWRLDDFANAVKSRCYPQLTAADRARLTVLYSAFTHTLEEHPLRIDVVRAAKNAYFDRATALCM